MGSTVHIYIVIFLYGIVTGSFLNVCIYRIPRKEDIVKRSSHCMSCGTKLEILRRKALMAVSHSRTGEWNFICTDFYR